MNPLLQIARRQWPESYTYLSSNISHPLEQAFALLNDYTKGDSVFWRFIYGHWNRNHTDEIARLVHYIANGLITSTEDLSYELEQINMSNEAGSLARRFSFWTCNQSGSARAKMTDCDNKIINPPIGVWRKPKPGWFY